MIGERHRGAAREGGSPGRAIGFQRVNLSTITLPMSSLVVPGAAASDELPLEGFDPGESRLTVLVRDDVSGETLERPAAFCVVP